MTSEKKKQLQKELEELTKEQLISRQITTRNMFDKMVDKYNDMKVYMEEIMHKVGAEVYPEVLRKMDTYFESGGDKVKLKKQVAELERENIYLKSLLKGV